jgi:hypothetical protein
MGVQLGSGHVNLTKWRGAFLAGRASKRALKTRRIRLNPSGFALCSALFLYFRTRAARWIVQKQFANFVQPTQLLIKIEIHTPGFVSLIPVVYQD